MKKTYTIYSLAIGFSLNVVFVLMFYTMLFKGTPIIRVDANSIGEYWIEFFLLQITLILVCITFIIEAKNYFKQMGDKK